MTSSQQSWFERNPKKSISVIIFILFFSIDFGLAAILKVFGLFEPSYITSSISEATYRKAHPVYHHGLVKNFEYSGAEWGDHGYTVRTNSLGFKDAQIRDISLTPTGKRLIIIGDSFTEGVGIEFKHTFVGLLAKQLAKKNIEVLNAAATSYSPIIYYRKIKYLLETIKLKFDQVLVLIDMSDMEDEALGYEFDRYENVISKGDPARLGAATIQAEESLKSTGQPKPPMSFKEFFTQYTFFTGRLRNILALYKGYVRPWEQALNQRRAMWTLDDKLYKEFGESGLKLATTHMNQLKQLLDKYHIKLSIAVYPWPDQIYNRDINSKQVKHWQAWARQQRVKFINLFGIFINDDKPSVVINKYFFTGDVHWNKQGHLLVFKALSKQLM